MEDNKVAVVVFEMEVPKYPNEYSEKFKTDMFVETTRVDPVTCVYRKWEGTTYSIESMPTAHIFE